MKFYEIDGALLEAINVGDKRVRLKMEYDIDGVIATVSDNDVLEADFFALREAAGGTASRGEVLIDNSAGQYSVSHPKHGAGAEVRVYFSVGDGLSWFHRFTLFVNDSGFQNVRGEGRKRRVRLVLRDRAELLRKSDEQKDWKEAAVFTYVTVCDKTTPDKSLLHLIGRRAGLTNDDIDCCTIPLTLPYVKLTKNIWSELSALATCYRCHLETATEKPLVFAHSPYQTEPLHDDDISYTFRGTDIFYFRITALAGHYKNCVRLKINLPVALEKQEIWKYADTPVLYTPALQAYYPFRNHTLREIENDGYEARYRVIDAAGKVRPVVYADDVDTHEAAQARIQTQGGVIEYSKYDVSTYHDRAVVTLNPDGDTDLFNASIHGRPIVFDLNRSHYESDSTDIQKYGTVALNVSGAYFSEDSVGVYPHYVDWVKKELAERVVPKKEWTVKTNRALFHARVGAKIKIAVQDSEHKGTVNSLTFHFRKGAAFVAIFKINEERGKRKVKTGCREICFWFDFGMRALFFYLGYSDCLEYKYFLIGGFYE